jgi:tetratricopeptide (TPR) repeat protein
MSEENEYLSPEDFGGEQDGEENNGLENGISDLSKKGYQLLRENRINEAVECFAKILAVAENNNYALVGMGDANRKQGIFRNAVLFYQRCLEHHPGNNYALFGLADCFKALGQYHKAIEIWVQYLLHDDKNITVLTRVADAYRKVRDYNHSKEVYNKVLAMDAQNPYAIIGLGHLYYDFKEYSGALTCWEKMMEGARKNIDIRVLTSIGNCHRKLKNFENGLDYFKLALDKEPNNFYALFGMADCYRGMRQPKKSLDYWNKILNQDPRNKMILTRAGDAYKTIGEYDKALDCYNSALNVEFDIHAVLGLAMVDKLQGRFNEAIESLRRLIQQDPRSYRFYLELADCWLASGKKSEAVEVLEEFQKQGIRNAAISGLLEKIRTS